jgi:O-antigen ligase
MVIFSPWAFGTTEEWSTWVMNGCGYGLGALMALKWTIAWGTGWQPVRWGERESANGTFAPARPAQVMTRLLEAATFLVLGYCLVSAVNARATWFPAENRFEYHACLEWLPHSYDSGRTWSALWNYLALAMTFWAVRDWLLLRTDETGPASREASRRSARHRGLHLPPRLQRLLWVLCLNSALLATEGILQRTSGTNKLLWLVEPRIIKSAEGQFGPYAYRSNAAQYFTLVWPVALGFWWVRHQAEKHRRRPRTTHHLLLPCALLAAACPLISLSRAGAVVGLGVVLAAAIILLGAQRETGWKGKLGLLLFLVTILGLGWYIGWIDLEQRFKTTESDLGRGRLKMWQASLQMVRDFPVFGTGPDTFEPVSQLYRASFKEEWMAQLHNDWLETLITFGALGSLLVLGLLGLALARWFFPGGITAHRVFVMFTWLALAGCLAHGAVDFPFQIYSLLFLFLLLCSMVSCLSRRA